MTSTSASTTWCGIELRNTDGSANKFYRVFYAGPSEVYFQWGAIDTRGSYKVSTDDDPAAAAVAKIDEKIGGGYVVVADPVSFEAESRTPQEVAAAFPEPVGPTTQTWHGESIVDEFARLTSGDAVDSEVWEDDGLVDGVAPLPEVGKVKRPNGTFHFPRRIGTHEDVAFMRAARGAFQHVLLAGPPGTGKTSLLEAFTDDGSEERGFYDLVMGLNTEESDLLGSYVQDPSTGNYVWNHGPLTKAAIEGKVFYADEIFLCDSRVLSTTLYPAMDGRGVLHIPQNPTIGQVPIKEGFFVVASGNPDVPGAVFSEALRDRFSHHIEVGTDWSLAKTLGVPADIVTVAMNLDKQRRDGLLTWTPQMRTLLEYRDQCAVFGRTYALSNLLTKAPVSERGAIEDALRPKFGTVKVAEFESMKASSRR